MEFFPLGICDRLRALRLDTFGPRGKSRFAKQLGIRPSTYQEYESNRVPPADLLVRAAQITGCDLVWLLTGTGSVHAGDDQTTRDQTTKFDEPIVERVRELLQRRPETAQGLSAFLLLIDPNGSSQDQEVIPPRPLAREIGAAADMEAIATNEMIPVIGSTAAGTARFWRELTDRKENRENWGDEADSRLRRLLEECRRSRSTTGRLKRDVSDPGPDSTVALIQLSQPDELGIVEFLSCPRLAGQSSRLIAWRIDGDSMAPRYRDGDFVLVRPEEQAVDGAPCVAHQRGQIGVNCKIFKSDGSDVVLIPVNESVPTQRFPASELIWAHPVLYSVRLAEGR